MATLGWCILAFGIGSTLGYVWALKITSYWGGYTTGYDIGHGDGYDEGFSDGLEQSGI